MCETCINGSHIDTSRPTDRTENKQVHTTVENCALESHCWQMTALDLTSFSLHLKSFFLVSWFIYSSHTYIYKYMSGYTT